MKTKMTLLLIIAAATIASCKNSAVTSTSSVNEDAQTGPGAAERGACVVIDKLTKKVQATCFGNRTAKECNESFKLIYEDVAPGKFESEFILKVTCEEGKKQVEDKNKDSAASNTATNVHDSNCVCSTFFQKKSERRYCLVAHRKSTTANAPWVAIAELEENSDCEKQCGLDSGPAAKALKSAACRN